MAREQAPQYAAAAIRAKVDELFPDLPQPVRAWLAEHPLLLEFLLQRNHDFATGAISPPELNHLVKQWSKALPLRRGAVVYLLQDFAQPELSLDLPKAPPKRVRRKGQKSWHRGRK